MKAPIIEMMYYHWEYGVYAYSKNVEGIYVDAPNFDELQEITKKRVAFHANILKNIGKKISAKKFQNARIIFLKK